MAQMGTHDTPHSTTHTRTHTTYTLTYTPAQWLTKDAAASGFVTKADSLVWGTVTGTGRGRGTAAWLHFVLATLPTSRSLPPLTLPVAVTETENCNGSKCQRWFAYKAAARAALLLLLLFLLVAIVALVVVAAARAAHHHLSSRIAACRGSSPSAKCGCRLTDIQRDSWTDLWTDGQPECRLTRVPCALLCCYLQIGFTFIIRKRVLSSYPVSSSSAATWVSTLSTSAPSPPHSLFVARFHRLLFAL